MYSQKSYSDPKRHKLGTCGVTIKSHGCFITSICNLFELLEFKKIDPVEMNKLCKDKGLYVNGCELVAPYVASHFKLGYKVFYDLNQAIGFLKSIDQGGAVIAETNHYAKVGVPQHFIVYNVFSGKRIDPLDLKPEWEKNDYKLVSFRVFIFPKKEKPKEAPKPPSKPPESPVNTDTPKEPEKPVEVKNEALGGITEEQIIEAVKAGQEEQRRVDAEFWERVKNEPLLIEKIIKSLINLIKKLWRS